MTTPTYDPLDTIQWMLDEARRELQSDTFISDEGKTKKKTKAQRNDDQVRFDTLCMVIWNVTGRSEPLAVVAERVLVA